MIVKIENATIYCYDWDRQSDGICNKNDIYGIFCLQWGKYIGNMWKKFDKLEMIIYQKYMRKIGQILDNHILENIVLIG